MTYRVAPAIAGLLTGLGMITACGPGSTLAPSPPSPPSPPSAPPVVGSTVLSVTSATPPAGLPGTTVRIMGTGFSAGTAIFLDGVQLRTFLVSTGILILAPPHPPGAVEVTATDEKGQRATLPGGYTYQSMTLRASASAVSPGAALTVSWDAPAGRDPADWVGLFRSGDSNENYDHLWWAYTGGSATGSKTLAAPMSPGQYEFRYFVEDGVIEAARSSGVIVADSKG